MRKLLLLVLVTLLATSVMPVFAIGESDLTTLASYVDDEALLYASIRTDDGLLESLDTLIARVEPFLPRGALPPGANASTLLDQTLLNFNIGTFDEAIRPWLGNSAAIAMFAPDSAGADPGFLALVEVDGEAALAFFGPLFEAQIEAGDIERLEVNGFTVFNSTRQFDTTSVAITDDTLFIASHMDYLPLEGVDNPLRDKALFNDTLAQLPEDSYLMLLYGDMQQLQRWNVGSMGLAPGGLPPFLNDLVDAYGGFALGFTIVNEESLVLDMVQSVNPAVYEQLGFDIFTPSELDYDFSNHIPDDALFVVQSADFGPTMQSAFNNIRALGDYVQANGGLGEMIDPDGQMFSDQERRIINQIDPAWIVGATNLTFAGFTGLNLERQVLPVLDGDVAFFVSLTPADDFMVGVVPQGALLFQSSDSAGAQAIVEQLGVSAEAYDLMVSREDYGNGTAIVLPAEDTIGLPYDGLDLLVGASDDILALGTRGAVNATLDTDNGLADNAAFQNASQYFVPGSQQMIYYGAEPLLNALDALMMNGDIPADDSMEPVYTLASLIESASITGTTGADGLSTIRFVITLAEEPRPFPVVPDA